MMHCVCLCSNDTDEVLGTGELLCYSNYKPSWSAALMHYKKPLSLSDALASLEMLQMSASVCVCV